MLKVRGMFKIISILAILHLLVLAGLAGFLWSNGTVNAERMEMIAGVLRGEYDPPAEDTSGLPKDDTAEARTSETAIAQEQMEQEIARLQLERERAELDQRKELVIQELIRVRQEREADNERRQREAEAAKRRGEENYREGFEKQLELFGKMQPKIAVKYILSRDVTEAAELLRALDTRKGKKIIEAAKTPNQQKKMDEILKLLPELNTGRWESAKKD